jgi:hypothetical protein
VVIVVILSGWPAGQCPLIAVETLVWQELSMIPVDVAVPFTAAARRFGRRRQLR